MNPYTVLNIEPECTDEQVKTAYHHLAKLYHPDRSGADTSDKMAELTEAYNLIKTEELRKKYDREHQNNSDFTLWSKLFGECNICKNFHKKPADKKYQKRGRNVTRTIRMSNEKLFQPGPITIKYVRKCLCYNCSGTGASSFRKCTHCNGIGKVRTVERKEDGLHDVILSCTLCNGRGLEPQGKCTACNGSGFINKDITLTFMHDGKQMDYTFVGKGHSGENNGVIGSVIIHLRGRKK